MQLFHTVHMWLHVITSIQLFPYFISDFHLIAILQIHVLSQ